MEIRGQPGFADSSHDPTPDLTFNTKVGMVRARLYYLAYFFMKSQTKHIKSIYKVSDLSLRDHILYMIWRIFNKYSYSA